MAYRILNHSYMCRTISDIRTYLKPNDIKPTGVVIPRGIVFTTNHDITINDLTFLQIEDYEPAKGMWVNLKSVEYMPIEADEEPEENTEFNDSVPYKESIVVNGKNTVISDKTVFKFVRPVYVGIIPADISGGVTSNMIIGMSKKIMIQDEITNSFTLTSGRMCIATPPGWEITKITDPNNLDITNSFEKHIVSITCLDGQSVGYNVYVSNVTAQTNFVVNFK